MKKNLIGVLSAPGHSGVLDGHCSIKDATGKEVRLEDVIEKEDEKFFDTIKITFSHGITPLGTHEFVYENNGQNELYGKLREHSEFATVYVKINWKNDDYGIHTFTAMLCP